MGLGGISPGSLLLIFFIVLILFGTKKLRSIGEDLGQAVRGFRRAMNSTEDAWFRTESAPPAAATQESTSAAASTIESQSETVGKAAAREVPK